MNCKVWIQSLMVLCLIAACNDKEHAPVVDGSSITVDTVNVDVVLPENIQKQWMPAISMAMHNIMKAQRKLEKRVELRLRYHDEDTEDLEQLAFDLTHPKAGDDTCHAILGPYHSDNAQTFLSHAAQTRLPVVMPTCTSSNLQRANARNTYAWFLTESDITQCEIMLNVASTMNASDVALIYSDGTYGQSFYDWFAFFAAEHNIPLAGDGTLEYQSGMDITPFLETIEQHHSGSNVILFLALANPQDHADVCRQKDAYLMIEVSDSANPFSIKTISSDTSLDETVANVNDWTGFNYGISPVGDVGYGFPQYYEATYGRRPFNGEVQIYDALCLIALGAAYQMNSPDECLIGGQPVVYKEAPFGPGLTDYMRALVADKSGVVANWTQRGLALAFSQTVLGQDINMTGATGDMVFDQITHTKILNTSYLLWSLYLDIENYEWKTSIKPVVYLNATNTSSMWETSKNFGQIFDRADTEEHKLPLTTDLWAVVISPSTSWENYRHQADAFAMYQLLRFFGYDDDHIVFIVEDNLAFHPDNIYPGQIFVERTNEYTLDDEHILANDDVRNGAVVDYHFSELRPEDLADILIGRQSESLPHVIHSDSASNVFFFWSGHGGSKDGPLWGNEDATEYFGSDRIRSIVEEMAGTAAANSSLFTLHSSLKKYRRMMFALETCFSGKWGEALTGLPDVLVLTAATPFETSKADVFDEDLGVFLSNAFARTFRNKIREGSTISIYDIYKELFRTTNGSHVTIYNESNYGSVYNNRMADYFPWWIP